MDEVSRSMTTLVLEMLAEQGVSANELGRRIGKSSGRMSDRLSGKSRWSLDDMFSVAEVLGVPADQFVAEIRRLSKRRSS